MNKSSLLLLGNKYLAGVMARGMALDCGVKSLRFESLLSQQPVIHWLIFFLIKFVYRHVAHANGQ